MQDLKEINSWIILDDEMIANPKVSFWRLEILTKWFSIQLLYKSVIQVELIKHDSETYEERIFIIKANSREEANTIAEIKGKDEEISYKNVYYEDLEWKFVKVIDIYEILEEEMESGVEVFSRFLIVPKPSVTSEVLKHYYQEE